MTTFDSNPIQEQRFVVALGPQLYQVERPFGAISPEFGKVTDVAVLPDGRIAVLTRRDHYTDAVCDCVAILSEDGTMVRRFGGDRIADAHKIACDHEGRIWVVDRDAHEIVAFDANGRELAALGTRHAPSSPFNHPSDVVVSSTGEKWIADGYAASHIHHFGKDDRKVATYGGLGRNADGLSGPHGIALLSDGRVVLADRGNDRVKLFSAKGEQLAVWDVFYHPTDIWVDGYDLIHVADATPTLTALTPDGEVVGRCRPTLNGPHGISGDAQGRIYLAEGNPSRVTRLVPIRS